MSENSIVKRKASSPCVSSKGKAKILDSNTTFESLSTIDNKSDADISLMNISMDENPVDVVTIRVATKDGEKFLGALSRPQAFSIWKKGLELDGKLVSGIALVQNPDKPFMIVYHLHDDIDLNTVKCEFNILIEEAEYCGQKVLPRPPPPNLGEEVTLLVTKTQFKIRPYHVDQWVSRFGKVIKKSVFKEADDLSGVTTDDIECKAILRKHMPGILPAFGRKMMLRYPGQPLVCGQCFEPGHLRKRCENKKVEWAEYVKLMVNEKIVPVELVGDWSRLL